MAVWLILNEIWKSKMEIPATMRLRIPGHAASAVIVFAAYMCLLGSPAAADTFHVTATFDQYGIGQPSMLSFDYSTLSSDPSISSVSPDPFDVTWNALCDESCGIIGVDLIDVYFTIRLTALWRDENSTPWIGYIWGAPGIQQPGTYDLNGGSMTISDTDIPEPTSLVLFGTAVGFALLGLRRHSTNRRV